jgi:hypothetical protein
LQETTHAAHIHDIHAFGSFIRRLRAAHAAFFFTNDKDGKNTECSTTAEIVEPTNYYWVCAKKIKNE